MKYRQIQIPNSAVCATRPPPLGGGRGGARCGAAHAHRRETRGTGRLRAQPRAGASRARQARRGLLYEYSNRMERESLIP